MMTAHYARLQKRDPQRNQYRYYALDVPALVNTDTGGECWDMHD
jgi:hypothetical protein